MGSSSGTDSRAPAMPDPKGSTTTPYGNATPFRPSFVNFLPEEMGSDGRMPMATGLNQGHLDAIRDAPPPPPLSAQPRDAMSGDMRTTFATLMADYEKEKKLDMMREAMLGGINPGRKRQLGDRGSYTSSGGSGIGVG